MSEDKYKISAIPTMYNGREYRSRLEAKWACFFDLLEIVYEYEPFDLKGWSPGFIVKNKYSAFAGSDILVEVKPLAMVDETLMNKMISSSDCSKYRLMILTETVTSNNTFAGAMLNYSSFSDNKTSIGFSPGHIRERMDASRDVVFFESGNPELSDKHWRIIPIRVINSYWDDASNTVKFYKHK